MTVPNLFTPAVIRNARPGKREYTLHDAHVSGLGLRVQPSGAKSWTLRMGNRRITIGAVDRIDLTDARAQALKLIAGEAPPPPPLSATALTFNALADAFLSARQGVYKPETLASCRVYLDTQLRPAFGKRPVLRLTTPEIAQWFHSYSRTRPGGANQALGLLVTMLNFARSAKLIPKDAPNPCAPIRKNRRKARGRLLSSDQITALGKALRSCPPSHRDAADAVRLILLTGCRSGEILRLRWSEVLPDRLSLAATKTGPREVLLSSPAIRLLAKRKKGAISPFVFPSSRLPNAPIGKIDHQWSVIRWRAGLPDDIRLHDLRHTYASHAIMQGQSLTIAGKLLGHARPASTERYAHLDGQYLATAAERVAGIVGNMMIGAPPVLNGPGLPKPLDAI
ncbi:DUF4102 domain-containing protein [Paracoccus versutus]|uniref:Site-specific recombinase XerD n=1 Tax=Paracoccus versutus TaxID=34007 RepID=A0AAQ0HGI6_PARVE|nr:site-specific integrase [Paracoccus versutus]REG45851.1 site-specific recombinase XerD [Paracoccus versutus]WEJ77701.1 DUF4102 domain-containing protein [Paracoccus versutus]